MQSHRYLLCLLMLAGQSLAGEWQDPISIRKAAETFAQERLAGFEGVKILAAGIDDRIRLPRCGAPLTAAAPRGLTGGQGVVSIRCAQPSAWQLFVPVRASYLIEVVVAAQGLRRSQQLTAADLRVEQRDSTSLPAAYLSRLDEAVGLTLRRSVPAGSVLNPAALDTPRAVGRGDLVTLIAGGSGVLVKSEGQALEDAALNTRLRVRTPSGRVVEGTVGPGNQVFLGAAARQMALDRLQND